jgi:plasmid stabilization system protein ParE
MRFVVVWEPPAEQDLTAIWLSSRFRYSINQAVDQIEAELKRNPHESGESRDGKRRIMIAWPLGVSFEIDETRREVRVISVWQI